MPMKALFTLLIFVLAFSTSAQAQLADGTYKQPCFLAEEDYLEASWSIQSGEWKHTRIAYEDSRCQTPWLSYEETYQLSFLKFNKVNFLNLGARYKVHSDEVARALNSIAFCDIQNWQAHQWQEVGGKTCQDFAPPRPQQATYSIISIFDGGFQIGQATATADGQSEETRHRELSPLLYELQ